MKLTLTVRKYNLYSLFSGGKDSISTAHVLSKRNELDSLVFFDTGIHTPDIIPHIEEVAKKYDWNLIIYKTPDSYEDHVMKLGFPSPSTHSWIMNRLKGRCVVQFKKEFGKEVFLASGIRQKESVRRRKFKQGINIWEGMRVVTPIFEWSTNETWAYVKKNDLPLSPAYQTLHMSGDCLCGAFAHPRELKMINLFYPELFERIERLEERVCKVRTKNCKWGNIGTKAIRNQTSLEKFICFECSA